MQITNFCNRKSDVKNIEFIKWYTVDNSSHVEIKNNSHSSNPPQTKQSKQYNIAKSSAKIKYVAHIK